MLVLRPISEGVPIPRCSMGREYLPTFTIKINHSCRYKYTSPMDPMGYIYIYHPISNDPFSGEAPRLETTPPGPRCRIDSPSGQKRRRVQQAPSIDPPKNLGPGDVPGPVSYQGKEKPLIKGNQWLINP